MVFCHAPHGIDFVILAMLFIFKQTVQRNNLFLSRCQLFRDDLMVEKLTEGTEFLSVGDFKEQLLMYSFRGGSEAPRQVIFMSSLFPFSFSMN